MQQEKNLDKAAKVLGYTKSELHSRETSAKTEVFMKFNKFFFFNEIWLSLNFLNNKALAKHFSSSSALDVTPFFLFFY